MCEYSYSGWHLLLRKGDTIKVIFFLYIKHSYVFNIYMQNRLELQWKPEIINWHTYFLETKVLQMSDSHQIKGTFLWVCFLPKSYILTGLLLDGNSESHLPHIPAWWPRGAFNQSSWLKMCELECWFALADKQPALELFIPVNLLCDHDSHCWGKLLVVTVEKSSIMVFGIKGGKEKLPISKQERKETKPINLVPT